MAMWSPLVATVGPSGTLAHEHNTREWIQSRNPRKARRLSGIEGERIIQVQNTQGGTVTARTCPDLLGFKAKLDQNGNPLVDGRPWDDLPVLDISVLSFRDPSLTLSGPAGFKPLLEEEFPVGSWR
jgi:hypothetical protein